MSIPRVKRKIDNGEVIQGLVTLHSGFHEEGAIDILKEGYHELIRAFFEDEDVWFSYADRRFKETENLREL